MQSRISELEEDLSQPDVWNDPQKAQKLSEERKRLTQTIERAEALKNRIKDAEVLIELFEPGSKDYTELELEFSEITHELREFEIQSYLSEPEDKGEAIMEIHSGAGGTEAQDWAEMLLRMYLRYCERKKWSVNVVDKLDGDEAGIKSATLEIKGEFAFGYLKSEIGVHRLVRISPFDSNRRRHTSFASVFIYPETEEIEEIEIDESDLKIDTFHSSGHGGQNVNKLETAVRITHIPTKTVVNCQAERSQHRNKELAMKLLKAKLLALKKAEEQEKQDEIEKSKKRIEWGSQIRSYVLHPYKMVKDLRTRYETSQAESVLDGEIEGFIQAYLSWGAE
jgi:peptide chain release factor 2